MRRRYLLAYDIRDEKRLRRAAKIAEGYGERLQYSVFVCDLSDTETIRLLTDLSSIVNQKLDRVVVIDVGDVTGRGVVRRLRWLGEHPRALVEPRPQQVV